MGNGKVEIDVVVTESLYQALYDVTGSLTPRFSAGEEPLPGVYVEWDQVWHPYADFCRTLDDVMRATRSSVATIAQKVWDAAGSYEEVDNRNVAALQRPTW